MAKIRVHKEPLPPPSTEVIKKYKNYGKIEGRLTRFTTLKGVQRLFKKNKMLFTLLFLAWLTLFLLLFWDSLD